MSEQALNSHEAAVAALEQRFGGGEPVTEPETAETEPQGTEQEAAEGQEPAQAATDKQSEEVEVEIDGEKYIVPKKISDRFIQHADYTRKTQDIAEMRRALSAEREAANLEKAFSQAVEGERQQLQMLDAQLAQYKKLDWSALDTEQLLKARAQFEQLKEARSELDEAIKSKRGEFDTRIKAVSQEAIQAGQKFIEQKIKGFDESSKKALFAYGMNEGYTRDELDRIIDPRIVVTLWKAQQWDTLQASAPNVTKKAASAAPVIRPGATQRGPSRIQQLGQAIKKASTPSGKARAAEDYFAAKFGGR